MMWRLQHEEVDHQPIVGFGHTKPVLYGRMSQGRRLVPR
jgi:hypothetical protein